MVNYHVVSLMKLSESCPCSRQKTYSAINTQLHEFLTLALVACKWSTSLPGCFIRRKESRYSLNTRANETQSQSMFV